MSSTTSAPAASRRLDEQGPPRRRRRVDQRSALALLVLLAASLLLVSVHVTSYRPFSPIDEFQHFDYVVKITSGELVNTGDRVGDVAMREESCRTVDAPGVELPPCGVGDPRPEQYQEGGYNTAAGHTPLYYLATGAVARTLSAATPLGLLDAARLTGALWLFGGLGLLFSAGRALGAARTPLVGAGLWIASTPLVLHASSTVNPDATCLLAGGAVLLAAVRWESGHWPLWSFALAAAAATALKVTNVLAVLAVLLLLVLRSGVLPGSSPAPGRGRTWRGVLIVGPVALVPPAVWSVLTAATATVDPDTIPMTQRFRVEAIGLPELVGNVPAVLTPLQGFTPAFLTSPYVALSTAALGWALLGALVGGTLIGLREERPTRLARASLLVALAGGPLLVALTFLSYHAYIAIPPRYGLALLPAMAVVLACTTRQAWGQRALLALGTLASLTLLAAVY